MCGKTASMVGNAVARTRAARAAPAAGLAPAAEPAIASSTAPPPGEGGSGLMRRRGRPGPASLLSPKP